MREIGAFEAKNKFGQLLDWVEQGEEITITRHGKEVARLVPVRHAFNRHEARSGVSVNARSNASLAASTGPNGNPTATKAARESCP